MATFTTRLGLTKPASTENVDITDIDDNFDLIDAAVATTVASAASKPASAFSGRLWYESDTATLKVNTASSASAAASWVAAVAAGAYVVANMPGASAEGSTGLNAAITALGSNGGVVLMPPGDHLISSQILINKHGVTLLGCGTGQALDGSQNAIATRLVLATGFSASAAILVQLSASTTTPVYGTTLRDFTIDGRDAGTSVDNIFMRSNRHHVDHVHSHRASGNGMRVIGYPSPVWNTYDSIIVNSQFADCASAGLMYDAGGVDCHLAHNVIYNNRDNLVIKGSSNQITANHFYDATRYNIFFDGGGSRSRIALNKIEGAGEHGINVDSANGGYSDIQIVGNGFANNGDSVTNTSDHLYVTGPSSAGITRTHVTGNFFSWKGSGNKPRYGVNLDTSAVQGGLVEANTFGSSTHFGTAAVRNNSSSGTRAQVRNNYGWATESGSTAVVAAGTTSIVVPHNLNVTPTLADVLVTPTNSMGAATKFWITTPTASAFTLNVDASPGASTTATFVWQARTLTL